MMASKTTSEIWNFFVRSDDKQYVKCNLCKKDLKYTGGTSSMHKHLQHVHKRSADSIVKTPAQAKVQSTLVAWQQSRKTLTSQRYESINKSLAIMCATDLRPTSIVNGEGFKRFVNKLNPDYQVPSKKTVTKYVTLAYEECKQLLRAAISGKDVALTTDLWTSHQRSYITVTAHYLTTDWQLKVNVLATRPIDDRHTGQNIAKHLKAIADEFGIRISAIVTDNASNMVRAAQEGNMPRVGCFAHTIQLCVNDGLEKQRRVSKAISTGKRVVTHFSHSNLSTQALLDQQAIMDPSQKAVKLVPRCGHSLEFQFSYDATSTQATYTTICSAMQ